MRLLGTFLGLACLAAPPLAAASWGDNRRTNSFEYSVGLVRYPPEVLRRSGLFSGSELEGLDHALEYSSRLSRSLEWSLRTDYVSASKSGLAAASGGSRGEARLERFDFGLGLGYLADLGLGEGDFYHLIPSGSLQLCASQVGYHGINGRDRNYDGIDFSTLLFGPALDAGVDAEAGWFSLGLRVRACWFLADESQFGSSSWIYWSPSVSLGFRY